MQSKPLVHQHLIVRAEVKKPLMTAELTRQWLQQLVDRIGMKIASGPHAEYIEKEGNRGVTGVVIIETSHCAIHIWDECNPKLVQLDVYSCSELPLEEVFQHLEVMEPTKVDYKYLNREDGLIVVK